MRDGTTTVQFFTGHQIAPNLASVENNQLLTQIISLNKIRSNTLFADLIGIFLCERFAWKKSQEMSSASSNKRHSYGNALLESFIKVTPLHTHLSQGYS